MEAETGGHSGALEELSAQLRGSGPVSGRLMAMLTRVRTALDVARTSLWLWEESGLRRYRLVQGPDAEATDHGWLPATEYPGYLAALQRQSVLAASSLAMPEVSELAGSYAEATGVRALLDAPVVHDGRLIGVLCCEATAGERSWTTAEQRFVTIAADLLAALLREERLARAEAELSLTATRLESLTAAMTDAVIMEDTEPRVVFVNAAGRAHLRRFGIHEPVGMHCCDVVARVAEQAEEGEGLVEWARQVIAERVSHQEVPLRLLDGTRLELDHLPVEGEAGYAGHLWQIREVTERWQTRAALERQRNLYHALSAVNQAVIREVERGNEAALLDQLCRAVVEHAGLRLAWVGEAQSDGNVVSRAIAGELREYLAELEVSTDPGRPEGRGPTGTALRTGAPVIINDFPASPAVTPWQGLAARAGVRSAAAFRIHEAGENGTRGPLGLSVYASERGFFDDEVVALLQELVEDIGYALTQIQRQHAFEAARSERDLLAEVLEHSPDYVGIADPEGREVYRNATARQWSGDLEEQQRRIHEAHPPWAWQRVRDEALPAAREEGVWRGETAVLGEAGEEIPVSQVIIAHQDPAGELRYLSTVARDIRDLKAAWAEIEYRANFDPVTDLPNRHLLQERLEERLQRCRRGGEGECLLFLDLDRFKDVNDALGHAIGDRLLRTIARRLQRLAGRGAMVARLAADEFVVLPGLASEDEATVRAGSLELAHRLHRGVARTHRVGAHGVFVEASVGVACFQGHAREDAEGLLTRADVAMYEAKSEGGGARLFEPWMLDRVHRRHRLESRLREALEADELCLHYQPQVALAASGLVGGEALVRWFPTDEEPISPAEFVPVAEESGLVIPLGEWVLDRALGHLREWLDAGMSVPEHGIAVNVSPHQFRLPDFVDRVEAALARHGVSPSALTLEITEGAVVRDTGDTIHKMAALREHGVTFAMDDFGTGYSSLSQLRRLPLDTLKVDRAFVRGVDQQPRSAALVGTILDMARHMALYAIAEGVETPAERAFVAERGCDAYQGFLHARPMSATEFARHLTR